MEIRKAGQPKKKEKDLKKGHHIRYTAEEWNQVIENAENAKMTTSEFIRSRTIIK